MKNAGVSKCANPQCEQEFKRLDEGKLYVRRSQKNVNGLAQRALWLCPACSKQFELRYDRQKHEYHMIQRSPVA
jgi:hypothetical protein